MASNDTAVVRIPGLTFGGALQISNATVVTTALAAVAISLIGMHCLGGMKKAEKYKKEWKRHSPRAIENKVMRDVMSFSTNIHTVANNMPQIRNMVKTLRGRIRNQIQAYESGDITRQEFDTSVRSLYQMVLNEMGIPANSVPQHVVNKIDAMVDRVANGILDGNIPAKVKFRMYKNHPALSQLHELGRQRALEVGRGHKYGLKALHTSAGIYVKPYEREGFKGRGKMWGHDRDNPLFPGNVHSNFAGWQRGEGYYGAWFRH
jgi:hypothetical protein